MIRTTLAAAALILAGPALAQDIQVHDPYALSNDRSAAVYMVLRNLGQQDDRLVAVDSPAGRAALASPDGDTDRLVEAEDGFPVAAATEFLLSRGGNHIALRDLTGPLGDGARVELTLTFARAGDIVEIVEVDNARDAPLEHQAMGRENAGDGAAPDLMDMVRREVEVDGEPLTTEAD
ncbi:MAG: copper chaperone PCu(A)C [Paracoccaceae bacterium]